MIEKRKFSQPLETATHFLGDLCKVEQKSKCWRMVLVGVRACQLGTSCVCSVHIQLGMANEGECYLLNEDCERRGKFWLFTFMFLLLAYIKATDKFRCIWTHIWCVFIPQFKQSQTLPR